MISVKARSLIAIFSTASGFYVSAQSPATPVPTSVNAKLVLDAAGPAQRKSLGAIYLIICPNGSGAELGSGFLLENGAMITNSHVVAGCTEQTLVAIGTANKQVRFSRVIGDTDRDLALLIPTEKLANGLKLAESDSPPPGTPVTTWGYPFIYDGASPLLSVGYVAGFREVIPDNSMNKRIKHIIVNGAFNHGNSGGPLLIAHENEVIGVVVLTYNFYPPAVKKFIDQLSTTTYGLQWTLTRPDGTQQSVSEAQVTAAILNEFYQKTQVMIGEAIGASELLAMLKEHASELPALGRAETNRPKAVASPPKQPVIR
jgi:S1-C subfamily serine protease